jgi:hypothetical protein
MKAINPQAKQVLARAPGLTSTESGVLYPTTEARSTAGPRPQSSPLKVRGGVPFSPLSSTDFGNIRPGGTQPPQPRSSSPSKLAEKLAQLDKGLTQLGGKSAQYGSAVLNSPVGQRAMGALGGYGAVTQGVDAYKQARRGDVSGATISGLGALGNVLTAIPPTRPVGVGLSTLSPAAQWMLQHSRKMSPANAQGALQNTDPMGNPIP